MNYWQCKFNIQPWQVICIRNHFLVFYNNVMMTWAWLWRSLMVFRHGWAMQGQFCFQIFYSTCFLLVNCLMLSMSCHFQAICWFCSFSFYNVHVIWWQLCVCCLSRTLVNVNVCVVLSYACEFKFLKVWIILFYQSP
jgi:hypothetical protein